MARIDEYPEAMVTSEQIEASTARGDELINPKPVGPPLELVRVDMAAMAIERAVEIEREKSQKFFAQYDADSPRSSFGIFEKEFVKGLLTRAQTAGLYDPTK